MKQKKNITDNAARNYKTELSSLSASNDGVDTNVNIAADGENKLIDDNKLNADNDKGKTKNDISESPGGANAGGGSLRGDNEADASGISGETANNASENGAERAESDKGNRTHASGTAQDTSCTMHKTKEAKINKYSLFVIIPFLLIGILLSYFGSQKGSSIPDGLNGAAIFLAVAFWSVFNAMKLKLYAACECVECKQKSDSAKMYAKLGYVALAALAVYIIVVLAV